MAGLQAERLPSNGVPIPEPDSSVEGRGVSFPKRFLCKRYPSLEWFPARVGVSVKATKSDLRDMKRLRSWDRNLRRGRDWRLHR